MSLMSWFSRHRAVKSMRQSLLTVPSLPTKSKNGFSGFVGSQKARNSSSVFVSKSGKMSCCWGWVSHGESPRS